jgi:hypothetical protein
MALPPSHPLGATGKQTKHSDIQGRSAAVNHVQKKGGADLRTAAV